jgi:hypothetical protein
MQKQSEDVAHLRDRIKLKKPQEFRALSEFATDRLTQECSLQIPTPISTRSII